jgi:hypothetical protein
MSYLEGQVICPILRCQVASCLDGVALDKDTWHSNRGQQSKRRELANHHHDSINFLESLDPCTAAMHAKVQALLLVLVLLL